ncbi:hypothetical protein [Azospirillum picis]|uniref:DUF8180 domain-containing protein n=1 Tax=Azospirillum picis TaxID=488438 RepID=A0ABU0MT01_9PROT|nr:hypothetical protein [Azospirillum picis]MBP2302652.1 hypothetical protein [Azospirillum picis]MDQ0536313.1 hypothetical protein [Azospirillum picis]
MSTTPDTRDRLRVILPHWIGHNAEHVEDMRRWLDAAAGAGPEAADRLREAMAGMTQAGAALTALLGLLGGGPGAVPGHDHHHGHHHHGHHDHHHGHQHGHHHEHGDGTAG